jgi:hypothetical protein
MWVIIFFLILSFNLFVGCTDNQQTELQDKFIGVWRIEKEPTIENYLAGGPFKNSSYQLFWTFYKNATIFSKVKLTIDKNESIVCTNYTYGIKNNNLWMTVGKDFEGKNITGSYSYKFTNNDNTLILTLVESTHTTLTNLSQYVLTLNRIYPTNT